VYDCRLRKNLEQEPEKTRVQQSDTCICLGTIFIGLYFYLAALTIWSQLGLSFRRVLSMNLDQASSQITLPSENAILYSYTICETRDSLSRIYMKLLARSVAYYARSQMSQHSTQTRTKEKEGKKQVRQDVEETKSNYVPEAAESGFLRHCPPPSTPHVFFNRMDYKG